MRDLDGIVREVRRLVDAGKRPAAIKLARKIERLRASDDEKQAALTEVFRYALLAGGDDEDTAEIVDAFHAWAQQAQDLAQTSPADSLAMFDELLSMSLGVPVLDPVASSVSYNRAAVLRILGREAEAIGGYQDTIRLFAAHPQRSIRFWVALALYNHARCLIERPVSGEVAQQLSALVAHLREGFANEEHAGVRRRVREATAWEIQLFENLGDLGAAGDARAQRRAVLAPLAAITLPLVAGRDPVPDDAGAHQPDGGAPQWPISPDELVMTHLESLDDSLDVLRNIARAQTSQALGIALATPWTLTVTGLTVLQGLIGGPTPLGESDADTYALRRGLNRLSSIFTYINGDEIYPLGNGPIEQLAESAGISLTLDDALDIAQAPLTVSSLPASYARALARECTNRLDQGEWLRALRLNQLLLAAAERGPNTAEGRSAVQVARFRWLFVARRVLNQLPDAAVLASALAAGQRLLRSPELAGRPGYLAEVQLALAGLYVDPYAASHAISSVVSTGPAAPDGLAALELGEAHLERALGLADAGQVPHILGMMLTIRSARAALGADVDRGEWAALADKLAAAVDPATPSHLLAQALMAQAETGRVLSPDALDRLLSRPLASIAAAEGQPAAAAVLTSAGQILSRTDRQRGRELFSQEADFIRGLPERERTGLLIVATQLLLDDTSLPGEVDSIDVPGVVAKLFPEVAAGHQDTLTFLTARWCTQSSAQADQRGDGGQAVLAHARACDGYLTLGLPGAAMESLAQIVAVVRDRGAAGLAESAVSGLAPVAVRAENQIGTAATAALQEIWAQVAGANRSTADEAAVFACVQLAKGARFACGLTEQTAFDAQQDPEAAGLLQSIAEIARFDGGAEIDGGVDELTLVIPYTELETRGSAGLSLVRSNLEHAFDALVQRRITAGSSHPPRPLWVNTVLKELDPESVLLWMFLARSESGGRLMITYLCTADRIEVISHPLDDGKPRPDATIRVNDGVRMIDPVGMAVYRMRQAVLDDPGPAHPVSRFDEEALEEGLPSLFGRLGDQLRQEWDRGRRHLIVIPHGSLHFAPLHLLYLDGRPLADTWTVTYLPNLALVKPPPPRPEGSPHASSQLTSAGLGFADSMVEPAPEAVDEARAVASQFGVPALITTLIDTEATAGAVLHGLATSRYVHLATHGVHDVNAPAFQSLYVADGVIRAHELLSLDLSQLELVTLPSCETALGRVDSADNRHGIPASLLLRGAHAVVGTLWPVEASTSLDFFTTLYRELGTGVPQLRAFRTAQVETRTAHPQYRDWGAFYYSGR